MRLRDVLILIAFVALALVHMHTNRVGMLGIPGIGYSAMASIIFLTAFIVSISDRSGIFVLTVTICVFFIVTSVIQE
jgi:hypothetical protein